MQKARDWQAVKNDQEAQRKQDIINRKALAAAKKQQKEREKVERAAITAQKRQLAAEAKAAKKAEKQAQKELKEEAYKQRGGQAGLQGQAPGPKRVRKTPKKLAKRPDSAVIALEEEIAIRATSRGRRVQKPQRFFE